MHKGAGLVLRTVRAIEKGEISTTPQPEGAEIKHAPKIFKETCEIQWNTTAENIRNFIRGLSPYPGAWTTIAGKTFKVFRASVADMPQNGQNPGQLVTDNKNYVYFKTKDGWISLDELQPEGKKKMTVEEFFRGNKI
jgi:methionyl-tRNA formyltransferase